MSQNEWLMLGFVVVLTVAYFVSQRATYRNGVWDGAYNTWLPHVRKILDEDHSPGSVKSCQRERALLTPDRGDGTRADGDGWRPVETAPWHTPILVGGWDKGTWTTTLFTINDEHWREQFEWTEDEPTHWRPLPPPPAAGDRDGGGR